MTKENLEKTISLGNNIQSNINTKEKNLMSKNNSKVKKNQGTNLKENIMYTKSIKKTERSKK